MKLSGTRVVVIDDTRSDVENLLRYLDRNSVPYNYFFEDADLQNLPKEPLKGVRVVFLDFVLGTDGAAVSTKMSTLMNVLSKVIKKENGPYIIMLWTKHNNQDNEGDLVPNFKARLFSNDKIPNPIAIIDLDKIQTMHDIDSIEQKINLVLSEENILDVLFSWESAGHESATHVLERLMSLAQNGVGTSTDLDDYIAALQNQIKRHFYHFAVASAGTKDKPNNKVLAEAQLPFTAILVEKLEQNIKNHTTKSQTLVDEVNSNSTLPYTDTERSIMNTYFLVSPEDNNQPRPGNVYKRSKVIKRPQKSEHVYLEVASLYKKNRYDNRSTNQADRNNYVYLSRAIIPILLEVTPSCDYAQNNWKGVRFVSGVLYPVNLPDGGEVSRYLLDSIKPQAKISEVGLFQYNNLPYKLVLHADYTLTLPFNKIQGITPLFRAKKELLVSVQHWLANHTSRPGKTEF